MSETSSNTILECRDLAKSFASAAGTIPVLQAVSFSLRESESLSIRGASGCGKSTLLNVLSGLETVDSGEVWWNGSPLERRRVDGKPVEEVRAAFIGFVFQSYYLIPELNALENILLAARISGRCTRQIKQQALDLMERVGLEDRARQLPHQMSGGERQRIAIARALINSPGLILADEPTGNLDERTGQQVMELLLNLCNETRASLILVTHNRAFAEEADRRYALHEGELTEERENP